jgi:proline iminopeptidase
MTSVEAAGKPPAPAGRAPGRRPVVTALLVCAVLAGALLMGTLTVLAAALLTDHAGLALAVGGLAELAAAAGGLSLLLRRFPHRRTVAVTAAAALVGASALAVLLPLPAPRLAPAPVPGQSYWRLPSGSQIRYVFLPARGRARPTPVVFLHGGPGVADLAGDAAYFGQLAADGFDVYVYDQVGSGGSSRLPNPAGYTVGRDVRDLEQIRQLIGADRMILIGHSYGGLLAAHYLAAYPGHVARLVLSSPAPLNPADTSSARLTARLDARRRLRLYATLALPRSLLAYALLQVNPAAAHHYLPDAEADAYNDRVYQLTEPALHCPSARHLRPPLHGTGFYRLQYPQSAAAPRPADPRKRLTGLRIPALILKGSCDYLSWQSALDYRQALPNATLVYLHRAGHNAYQDQPAAYLAVVRAFLTGRPLPIPPWTGSDPPPDYQGPHAMPVHAWPAARTAGDARNQAAAAQAVPNERSQRCQPTTAPQWYGATSRTCSAAAGSTC